jgi:hypothetical protein
MLLSVGTDTLHSCLDSEFPVWLDRQQHVECLSGQTLEVDRGTGQEDGLESNEHVFADKAFHLARPSRSRRLDPATDPLKGPLSALSLALYQGLLHARKYIHIIVAHHC